MQNYSLILAGILAAAAAGSLSAQQGAVRAGYNPPPSYAPIPSRPAILMPNAAQQAAIDALNAAVQSRVQAVATARAGLVLASVNAPGTLQAQADALAAAELALANARAEEFARLQSNASLRLTATQVGLLRTAAAAGTAAAAPAGGGGRGGAGGPMPADPNTVIQTLPGFRVELVAKANTPVQGSWISLTEDDQGRLILGGSEMQPFTRITLDSNGQVAKNETINTPISEAMGLTWIDDALYVGGGRAQQLTYTKTNATFCCESGDMGLHRLSDPQGDGSFSKVETLFLIQGDESGHSDHGVHDPVESPDGRYIYMINGNRTYTPASISPNSPVRHNRDDRVIPTLGEGGGRGGQAAAATPATPGAPVEITGGGTGFGAAARAAGRFGYGGWIARVNKEGQDLHLFAIGLRNPLHFDFNADGEIFTYDSDHEPERGVPWYTPTRVLWVPSAANFGHRLNAESGKYPAWYEDATAPLYNIGLGSPVGVTFGYNSKFPALYQKALYIADNNYGRIMALHIKPVGSGYTVTSMDYFAYPKALFEDGQPVSHNVTGMVVGRDGNLYYAIGTRTAQAYLMRIVYEGPLPTAKVTYTNVDGAADRKIRHDLEAFHWTSNDARAITAAWPHLGSEDRPLRYAARVALETNPASAWRARAVAERDPQTALESLLALARIGGAEASAELYTALAKFPLTSLPDRMAIQKLRIYQVALSRNGKPSEAVSAQIVADVESIFPAKTFDLNTESSMILAYFNAPSAVPKTMAVIARTKIYQENFALRYNIRSVTTGWTPEYRKTFFQWMNENHAGDTFVEGYREWAERVNQRPALSGNNMGGIRTAAIATLTDAERADADLMAIVNAAPAAGGGGRAGAGANPFGGAAPAGPGGTPALPPAGRGAGGL